MESLYSSSLNTFAFSFKAATSFFSNEVFPLFFYFENDYPHLDWLSTFVHVTLPDYFKIVHRDQILFEN